MPTNFRCVVLLAVNVRQACHDQRQAVTLGRDGSQLPGRGLVGHCARLALQAMTARRSGVILNISSVHETIAWSGYSAYTASKAAIAMMTKTMAQEAAPFGVRVLAVAPGAIQTEINKAVWSDPKQMPDLIDKIPLGRMGQVQEIAGMVTVLVSDVGAYVTGTSIFIDGGMTDYPSFAHGG